ncbi:PhnE/PtxC family ABC transporter permease [Natronoarchaeum rubrum]|uniref:PhnE/PtxC family ABC transporter permease n=1 Tax=Natronoarchaeum rubrum TaxID=755311 RepID=UPI00211206F5|nr:phosphate/phosphonate ABC transporter permease [Natronoarchaeum rubrum]
MTDDERAAPDDADRDPSALRSDGGAAAAGQDAERGKIEGVLASIERKTWLRRGFYVFLLAAIVIIAYAGIGYLAESSVSRLLRDLGRQMPTFLENVRDFLAPNFVDFTAYSQENQLTGWNGLLQSFAHPSTFIETIKTGSNTYIVSGAVVTIVIGFTGTVLGFPLALLFGVLGSERVTPFPFNFIFRGTMSTIRAVPALVWVLIYIPLANISPISAMLAVATDTVGNLGRLFTDELEETEEGPIEAIRSTGANRPQVISFGMLSQVSSSFIAWTLYILEINTRIAVSLGVVGAGGIGQYLDLRLGFLAFDKAVAALIMVVFMVLSVEMISSRLRARLRPGEESKSLIEAVQSLFDGRKWLGTNLGKN